MCDFARDLERENAALRDAIHRIQYVWVHFDRNKKAVDEAICAAIDAARKEQP